VRLKKRANNLAITNKKSEVASLPTPQIEGIM
jgi:hypothetical protein